MIVVKCNKNDFAYDVIKVDKAIPLHIFKSVLKKIESGNNSKSLPVIEKNKPIP